MELHVHSRSQCWGFVCFASVRSISVCSYICASALFCLEDSVFPRVIMTSGSYILSASSSTMFPEPEVLESCCRCISWGQASHNTLISAYDLLLVRFLVPGMMFFLLSGVLSPTRWELVTTKTHTSASPAPLGLACSGSHC